MDYSSQHGLSRFTGRKMMIFLFGLLLFSTTSTAILTESENAPGTQTTTEAAKSEISKREEPAAQRREHSFNADGSVNYHGSGSGHDSGDLVPPPGGSGFNSPSINIGIGHTGSSGPGLSNSYGVPIPSDSYGPPKNIFDGIKPPTSFGSSGGQYLPPKQSYGPPPSGPSAPPKPVYGPPKSQFRPPSPPKSVYGPPQFRPPKPTYGAPKPIRPKPSFSSRPKPVYGPPKSSFGTSGFSHGTLLSPVGGIKSHHGPPKISATYGTPLQPSTAYGVPKHPKPGHIKAPPTPPDVKYDGWKPIPGLVSNPPSGSYGVPDSTGHGVSGSGGFSSFGHISSSGFGSSGSGFGSLSPPSSSYGAPSFGGTSFGSSGFGIQLKPVSTYGPPKPSSTYGLPLQPSTSYGPPSGFKGSSQGNFFSSFKGHSSSFGPPGPGFSHGPSKPGPSFGSLKPPSSSYGVPQIGSSYGPPKAPSSSYGPPKLPSVSFGSSKIPSSFYGPPKPPSSSYGSPKPPRPSYGPPKPPSSSYGPPKSPSSSYGPPKFPSSAFGPPSGISNSFSPPKPPSSSYGPSKPPTSSYGPPKAPTSSYGPPKPPSSSYGPPQVFTTYSIPKPGISISGTPHTAYRGPPVPHPLQPPSFGNSAFSSGLYKAPLPPNALYGVPTAPAPPTSIGFDFSFQGLGNTYGAPSLDLHAPIVQQVPSIEIGSHQFNSFSSGGLSQSYGTPLFPSTPATTIHHSPASTYGVPTALPLRQPKHPVKFRPPVPAGLISSIGAKWGDSAVWGANSESHKFHGNTYIPPAVPDPDPGIRANQGTPLVIPPPSAPPINYGPPPSNQHSDGHHHSSNQFTATTSSGHGESDLNPPPPSSHGQSSFDIQQSTSVELHGSNNLDNHGGVSAGPTSSGSLTSYNAPVDISSNHQHSSSSVGSSQNFGGVQNIPITGNQGSYTLQIQSAGGNSGDHVPHNEVLSNGLLQDILAAIENPSASGQLQQYGNQQSNDPVASEIGLNILKQLGGNDVQQSNSIQLPSQYGSDLSHSSSINVPQYAKTSSDTSNEVFQNSATESKNSTQEEQGKIAHYLNQNKIALYYNNQEESGVEERKGDGKDILLVQMLLPNNSTSSQTQSSEFGGVVSFNLPNAQSNNSTLQTQQVS